jgi:hypothetical protein
MSWWSSISERHHIQFHKTRILSTKPRYMGHTIRDVIEIELYPNNIVTCLLKARTVEPKKTSVARQWLCKHVSMTTKSRDCSNRYTQQ